MQAVESRSTVLNPSLGRTSSTFEVVEMRRRLARKTDQAQAPATPRQKRATAQLYADEGFTVDGEASAKNRVNRLLTGFFLTAATALMLVVLFGGIR